jgi:hypothetical protein
MRMDLSRSKKGNRTSGSSSVSGRIGRWIVGSVVPVESAGRFAFAGRRLAQPMGILVRFAESLNPCREKNHKNTPVKITIV